MEMGNTDKNAEMLPGTETAAVMSLCPQREGGSALLQLGDRSL